MMNNVQESSAMITIAVLKCVPAYVLFTVCWRLPDAN